MVFELNNERRKSLLSFTSNQVKVFFGLLRKLGLLKYECESITDIHPLLAINKEVLVYTIGTAQWPKIPHFVQKI